MAAAPISPHHTAQQTRRYLPHSDYWLPKDRAEAFRLNFQHYALLHAIGSLSVAPITPTTRLILDVGDRKSVV